MMTGVLGAAVAAPIAMTEGPKHLGDLSFPSFGATPPAASPNGALRPPVVAPIEGPGALLYRSPAPIEGVGFLSLGELLRMDVSKEWVYARWARKSTGLADPGLFGVRVPVVTGTGMTDLAGSMSYYFNADGRVDRLRFHGRTADTTGIVAIARQQFGMTPRSAPAGEQLLQAQASGGVLAELRSRPEPVLWSTSPHNSFVVDLEINRPGTGRFVEQRRLTPDLPPPAEPPAAPPAEPPAVDPPAPAEAVAGDGIAEPEAEVTEAEPLPKARRPFFRWPN